MNALAGIISMPELDELTNLHRDGTSIGEILKAMKERGLTIAEAIKASMAEENV